MAVALLCAVSVVVIAGVTGVDQSQPSVAISVKTFLLSWETGDYAAAAKMTTGAPAVVARSLRAAYSQLGAANLVLTMGGITVHGSRAQAYFNASIDLGRGGRPWQYRGNFALRRSGSRWLVVWAPSVIVPGLGPGDRLAVLTRVPGRAPLLDASGKPLILLSRAFEVGVVPDEVTDPKRTTQELAKVTGLAASEGDEMRGQILAAPPNSFLELLQLSPGEFRRLGPVLGKVPDLTHRTVIKRLFRSAVPEITGAVGTEAAKVLVEDGEPYRPGTTVGLSGLQQAFQSTLAGTATTKIVVQNSAGQQVRVLQRWQGEIGTPVRTTIDAGIQQAARRALAGLPFSAAIVAIRPGSGQILAVSQYKSGAMPEVNALTGHYEPGQSFTIVSTAAILSALPQYNINTPIPCHPTNPVGGQTFANVPAEPPLGKQPKFSVDFAHACSTAFVGLALLLHPSDLADQAEGFGIGIPWQLPLPAFVGGISNPGKSGERAADMIGTGTVRVSPLDMALAAGAVESGSWHQPSLVACSSSPTISCPSDPRVTTRVALKGQVISQLREMMADTVRSGAARAAQVPGTALFGQVGTAPVAGHRGLRAIWFVGYRGNVAFAVLAFSRSTKFSPAVQIAHRFADALRTGF